MAEVFYVTFGDYCRIAAEVLGTALTVERFLAANGRPIHDADPETDVAMVERIAAGEATPKEIIGWLERRTSTSS